MTPDQEAKRDGILEELLSLEPWACSAFLDATCGGDAALRVEVERLLAVRLRIHSGFLEPPESGNIPLVPLPGENVGRYVVRRQIGIGGRGVVSHVHRAGIIHRDIKPASVFIQTSGRVTSMDFGISRLDKAHGCPSLPVGTLPYMAPELLRGEPATTRSDVYSYGVVLYELLSG